MVGFVVFARQKNVNRGDKNIRFRSIHSSGKRVSEEETNLAKSAIINMDRNASCERMQSRFNNKLIIIDHKWLPVSGEHHLGGSWMHAAMILRKGQKLQIHP